MYLYSELTKLLLILCNMNYPRTNLIYLKHVFTFQSSKIKFEDPKSSLPFKRFIVRFLTTLNPRKPKVRQKHLWYLVNSHFYDYKPPRILHQYRFLQNIRKNKDIVITKSNKENRVVILDQELNNALEEIISNTSKFKKLNEAPVLKNEASLQRFLRKLKQKHFFNKIEFDKLYPSGTACARIYGIPKKHKFSSSDSFPKLCPIVSSIGTFNYNLARFLFDLLSPLVPND